MTRTVVFSAALLGSVACSSGDDRTRSASSPATAPEAPPEGEPSAQPAREDEAGPAVERARAALVAHLREQGIEDERVLDAIAAVPRHRMVPHDMRPYAYADRPLPIGHEQTISQPFIVALMTQLAQIGEGDRVLEVGTGSGYQAAVLAEAGAEVYSVEIVEPLARRSRALLDRLGYQEAIHTRIGDGYRGWPEHAPFDAIVITAAPPAIPDPLKEQLAVGGRMVVPVGEDYQELVILTRTEDGVRRQTSIPVRFVPMTGEAQEQGGE